jgi:hypothetical protein
LTAHDSGEVIAETPTAEERLCTVKKVHGSAFALSWK